MQEKVAKMELKLTHEPIPEYFFLLMCNKLNLPTVITNILATCTYHVCMLLENYTCPPNQ